MRNQNYLRSLNFEMREGDHDSGLVNRHIIMARAAVRGIFYTPPAAAAAIVHVNNSGSIVHVSGGAASQYSSDRRSNNNNSVMTRFSNSLHRLQFEVYLLFFDFMYQIVLRGFAFRNKEQMQVAADDPTALPIMG